MKFARRRAAPSSAPAARDSHPAPIIVCATNRAYLPHCGAMLHSLMTLDPGSRIHVFLERDISDADAERLRHMAGDLGGALTVHPVPYSLVADLAEFAPAAAWVRVFLSELLPENERVIYLDCDLIVMKSLRELWETNLSGHAIGAVTTVFPSPEWGNVHCSALGIQAADRYFNSGVMVMDLRALRDGDHIGEVRAFAREHGSRALTLQALESSDRAGDLREYARLHPEEMLFGDQDALNAVLADRRHALPPHWNCMNQLTLPWSEAIFGSSALRAALGDPSIRHFEGVGNAKPWDPDADSTMRTLYWRHRSQTPWPAEG